MMQILNPRYSWGLSALLLIFSLSGYADTLSLLSAYEHARDYDAQLKGAIANNQGRQEDINKARAGFLPKVQLSAAKGKGQTDSTNLANSQTLSRSYSTENYSLSLRQPLFNKQAMAEYRLAEANISRSDALLLKEHSGLISRVVDAYINVLFSDDSIQFLKAQQAATQEQLTQATKRYEHGLGTITEISEAQASLDLIDAQLREAESGQEQNQADLEIITGVDNAMLLKLNSSSLQLETPVPANLDAWIAQSLDTNPDILAARKQIEVSIQDIERSRSGHFPSVDLVASRTINESDNNVTIGQRFDTSSIGVQMNLPLFAGGYVNASVRQAYAAKVEAEEELNLKTRQVTSDIRRFFNATINAINSVRAYEQAEKSNLIAVEGTKKGFDLGTRTNLEVLNAEQKLYDNRRNLARARYQYVSNLIKLKDSAGQLSLQDIERTNKWFE